MSWEPCVERPKVGNWIRPCAPEYAGKGQAMKIERACFITEDAKPGGEMLARWEVWTGPGDPTGPRWKQPGDPQEEREP